MNNMPKRCIKKKNEKGTKHWKSE